jgi:hypothetical protein
MNYKVMQRPMFKMGGKAASQGTGITSGLDEKVNMSDGRANYSEGPTTYQDFLDRAMTNYNLRTEKMDEMNDLINMQALSRVGNVLATEESNNPFDILQNIAMSGSEIALPALSAQKKLELKKLDPTTDLAFAKALKPTSGSAKKVYEMKLAELGKLEKQEAELRNKFSSKEINEEQLNDGLKFLQRRYKLISSQILTENDFIDMAREGFISQGIPYTDATIQKEVEKLKKIYNFAEGGRVDRAMGTPEMGEQPMMNPMAVERQDVAMETQDQGNDAYAMLRARLPQEIPDDVVKLIAYNKQAFADFASIKNQEDVSSFNQKYNVSMNIDVSTV